MRNLHCKWSVNISPGRFIQSKNIADVCLKLELLSYCGDLSFVIASDLLPHANLVDFNVEINSDNLRTDQVFQDDELSVSPRRFSIKWAFVRKKFLIRLLFFLKAPRGSTVSTEFRTYWVTRNKTVGVSVKVRVESAPIDILPLLFITNLHWHICVDFIIAFICLQPQNVCACFHFGIHLFRLPQMQTHTMAPPQSVKCHNTICLPVQNALCH